MNFINKKVGNRKNKCTFIIVIFKLYVIDERDFKGCEPGRNAFHWKFRLADILKNRGRLSLLRCLRLVKRGRAAEPVLSSSAHTFNWFWNTVIFLSLTRPHVSIYCESFRDFDKNGFKREGGKTHWKEHWIIDTGPRIGVLQGLLSTSPILLVLFEKT